MIRETSPQICVIVPAYNVSAYIGAAIASLKAQGFAGFEALVIDDGSTDDTAAQARTAIGTDPRFRLIQQPNRGLSGARNAALDLARAPFIAFLDGDDRFDPAFLQVLHDDLSTSGAPWVACGVAFCAPDGSSHTHSAIHGRPVPQDDGQTTACPLADWSDVICHFPSAWNKLYRRDFIGDLRFDEGTWYEDHTFFQRLAAKTGALRHIPRPLYLYTLQREGQITRADSDRVFEQFAVLETSADIFRTAGKSGADKGLARLATRLFCERLEIIRSPDRAARFRREASRFFARHQISPDWRWDRHLSALTTLSLTGDAPVIISPDPPDAGTDALLPDPDSPLATLFRCAPPDQTPGAESLVITLPAQARIDHAALAQAAEVLLHGDLAAVLLPLAHPGPDTAGTGTPVILSPDDALGLDPARHAILTRPAFAAAPRPSDPQRPMTDQALRLSTAQAPVAWLPTPIAPAHQPLPPDLRRTLRALDQWPPALTARLPPGWKRRLALRAGTAWLAAHRPLGRRHLLLPLLQLGWSGVWRGWIGTPGVVDADTSRVLRRIFRLPPIG